jgi:glycosyltransferase involved in cell wall biosynthesis
MSGPLVSVVIPTYNRPCLLIEAVQSVLDQTYKDFEIIIIDDHSTDETAEKCRELVLQHEKIRYFSNEFSKGAPGAKNTGIKHAKGEYISFLDDDDLWDKEYLRYNVELAKKDPSIGLILTNVSFFGEDRRSVLSDQKRHQPFFDKVFSGIRWISTGDGLYVSKNKIFHQIIDSVPHAFQRIFLKKDLIKNMGMYSDSGLNAQEWTDWYDCEFILRAAMFTRVGYIKRPLYRFRVHGAHHGSRRRQYETRGTKVLELIKSFTEKDPRLKKEYLKTCRIKLSGAYAGNGYNRLINGDIKTAKEQIRLSMREHFSANNLKLFLIAYLFPGPYLFFRSLLKGQQS